MSFWNAGAVSQQRVSRKGAKTRRKNREAACSPRRLCGIPIPHQRPIMTLRSSRIIPAALVLSALTAACAGSASPDGVEPQPRPAAVAPDSGRVYDVADVQVKPRLLNGRSTAKALEMNYPPDLRDAGLGGTVDLTFILEPDGSASDVQVTNASYAASAFPRKPSSA